MGEGRADFTFLFQLSSPQPELVFLLFFFNPDLDGFTQVILIRLIIFISRVGLSTV